MNQMVLYAGTSYQRLLDLITHANGTAKVPGVDYELGLPRTANGLPNGHNTLVSVTPLKEDVIKDTVDLDYCRLNIAILNNLPPGWIQELPIEALPFSIHGLLPAINNALGLDLQPGEVLDETFTTVQPSYRIRIDENISYAWIGYIDLIPHWPNSPIPLTDVVQRRIVDGLNFQPSQ